jgi:hypothetical protein
LNIRVPSSFLQFSLMSYLLVVRLSRKRQWIMADEKPYAGVLDKLSSTSIYSRSTDCCCGKLLDLLILMFYNSDILEDGFFSTNSCMIHHCLTERTIFNYLSRRKFERIGNWNRKSF